MAADVIFSSDVVFVPSTRDLKSITLLEAWAMNKPCFARKVGIAATHPEAVFPIEDEEDPYATATQVVNVYNKILTGEYETLGRLVKGRKLYDLYYNDRVVVPLWRNLINHVYIQSISLPFNDTDPMSSLPGPTPLDQPSYFPRLDLRAIHADDGAPSHIVVTSLGRTRLLTNVHPSSTVFSLAQLDITSSLKALVSTLTDHVSNDNSSRPKTVGSGTTYHVDTSRLNRWDQSSQQLEVVIEIEYETITGGRDIGQDGAEVREPVGMEGIEDDLEKTVIGSLDVHVDRWKGEVSSVRQTTNDPTHNQHQIQSSQPHLSIQLTAESHTRVKSLVSIPPGWKAVSLNFRLKGRVTIRVFGVAIHPFAKQRDYTSQ